MERASTFTLIAFAVPLCAAAWFLHSVWLISLAGIVLLWLLFCLVRPLPDFGPGSSGNIRLGPMIWTMEDFMRHWLIVGRSGCGKTLGAIKQHMIAFFKAQPTAGGIVTDEKGDFAPMVEAVFKALGLAHKLLVVRAPPPADYEAQPLVAMNLIGDRRLSWATYASMVVDVAISQGQKTEQPFFKFQARDRIEDALETLDLAQLPVTLVTAYEFFKLEDDRLWVLEKLEERGKSLRALHNQLLEAKAQPPADQLAILARIDQLLKFWVEFAGKADAEASGIKSNAENYLRPYAERGLENTFSAYGRPDLISLDAMDEGKVIIPAIPQTYPTGRGYVVAFFKVLYYRHSLMRFDLTREARAKANPHILYADEGHNQLLPTEGGLSDLNSLDKIRAAGCTILIAMQDFASAVVTLEGKEKAEVLFANLNNILIFSLNTPSGRKIASDTIGEEEQWEHSYSRSSKTGRTVSRHKRMKPVLPPTFFRKLKRFQCVMIHAEGQHAITKLYPVTDDGSAVEPWYYKSYLLDLMKPWK